MYDREYFVKNDYLGDWRRNAMKHLEAERILDMLPPHKITSVLDVGCGIGDFISDYFSWARLAGVDVSDYAAREAESRGVTVMSDVDDFHETFDLILFRGTIQHIDEPLRVIKRCITKLNSGGMMVFLATPNSESLVYRLFGELPALDAPRNFVVFGRREILNILNNLGMNATAHMPYMDTPYAYPIRDLWSFIKRLFGFKVKFAFPGNMMEIYSTKKGADAWLEDKAEVR